MINLPNLKKSDKEKAKILRRKIWDFMNSYIFGLFKLDQFYGKL
jgi:hypothetical protein